jgi:hypothetical protein
MAAIIINPPNLAERPPSEPLTAAMLDDIADTPPFYNPPAFDCQPKHGSQGVAPVDLRMNTILATTTDGGFPGSLDPFHDNNAREYTTIELHNIIRLATVVWGVNCKNAISDLIGDKLRCSLDGTINSLVGDRIGATTSYAMYYMVQENVESYDLGIRIRTLARTSVRAGVAVAGEGAPAIARRQIIATRYRAAAYSLRTRAIDAINDAIGAAIRKHPSRRGDVLASRLEALRTKFSVDPFESIIRTPNLVEPAYFNQTREANQQFWFTRFDENVVVWFWDFLGIIDLRKTLDGAFGLYAKEEFAFACEAMWQCVIAANVEREHLLQSRSVTTRTLEAYAITQIDRTNYRVVVVGLFNHQCNATHDVKA